MKLDKNHLKFLKSDHLFKSYNSSKSDRKGTTTGKLNSEAKREWNGTSKMIENRLFGMYFPNYFTYLHENQQLYVKRHAKHIGIVKIAL